MGDTGLRHARTIQAEEEVHAFSEFGLHFKTGGFRFFVERSIARCERCAIGVIEPRILGQRQGCFDIIGPEHDGLTIRTPDEGSKAGLTRLGFGGIAKVNAKREVIVIKRDGVSQKAGARNRKTRVNNSRRAHYPKAAPSSRQGDPRSRRSTGLAATVHSQG